MVRVVFWGGINEIFKNKIRLEDGDRRLLLDFGLPYEKCKLFCEEYLRPRICKGLFDRLTEGISSGPRGIYRHDMESPEAEEAKPTPKK